VTTYGSLFTGAGGFDLGCDAAGWDCQWQVEVDLACSSVLAKHWPDATRYQDVKDVSGSTVAPVNVVTFGFPCQDLSIAGRRAGLDGVKSGLFFEAVRIIKQMREATDGQYPNAVVVENVAGLLSADKGAAMGRCLDELAELGALGIEWRVFDANHFGVPQKRRRLFIVALWNPRTASRREVFADGAVTPRDLQQDGHLVGFYKTQGRYDGPQCGALPPLKAITPCAITGRGVRPRQITPLESERAMGWPDNHTKYGANSVEIPDSVRYKMCGNGVVAPVARYVAESVERVLNV